MLAALGMRCAALAPRLRAARRLATPARLAPSPLDEDFLLPDRDGDGFGERPPPRRRETQKLCYKCGEPGHLARDWWHVEYAKRLRTSVFCGWTLTSTRSGGIASARQRVG